MADTLTIVETVIEYLKIIAIEPVQAIKRTEPHKAAAVLQDTGDVGLGEAVFCGEPGKVKIRILGINRNNMNRPNDDNDNFEVSKSHLYLPEPCTIT